MPSFRPLFLALLLSLGVAGTSTVPAQAGAAPDVVASIKPVDSLVAAVMQGIGSPHLIVRGGGSPHTYTLKPSDARALEHARVVFWIGPGLELFLTRPLTTLARHAKVVALADAPGVYKLRYREGGGFEAPAEEGKHGVAHLAINMHIWLDPANAKAMVHQIAAALAAVDPANAVKYQTNAANEAVELDTLSADLAATLAPVKDKPFVVFHDAYQYFEHRFGLRAAGSITVSPQAIPGARRIAEVHAKVKALGAICVFAEPEFQPRLVHAVIDGTQARTGVLDPLGADLAAGPGLYFKLLRNMASSLVACLRPGH